MKRIEKNKRETLARIFYTMIRVHHTSLNPSLELKYEGLSVFLNKISTVETPLPFYLVNVIRKETVLITTTINIDLCMSNYEVREFESRGLKTIKEVIQIITRNIL